MNEWYKDFFEGATMDFWKQAVPEDWTADEINFLEKRLEVKKGDRILDALCGFGRHALGLAEKGYRLTGIDISKQAIDSMKKDASERNLHVETVQGDILDMSLGHEEYDGAYCLGNSFGYFDMSGMSQFLKKTADALKSGARFAVNTAMAAESFLTDFPERTWTVAGDVTLLVENDYHPRESVVETSYVIVRGGKTEKKMSRHYIMTVAEILDRLKKADFEDFELYGSTEGEPFRIKSPQLYIVGRKR